MSKLYHLIFLFFKNLISEKIFLMTQLTFDSLTTLADFINFVALGNDEIKNHGSSAIQWPPTPGPGLNIHSRM